MGEVECLSLKKSKQRDLREDPDAAILGLNVAQRAQARLLRLYSLTQSSG